VFTLEIAITKPLENCGHLSLQFIDSVELLTLIFGGLIEL